MIFVLFYDTCLSSFLGLLRYLQISGKRVFIEEGNQFTSVFFYYIYIFYLYYKMSMKYVK